MTLGEFKEWCDNEELLDNVLLVVADERGQTLGAGDTLHVEVEGLEISEDKGEHTTLCIRVDRLDG